jgi:hypothetical protein
MAPNQKCYKYRFFRTPATIQSARAKGGGQEGETYYPQWRRISKSIDRFHFLLVRLFIDNKYFKVTQGRSIVSQPFLI